MSNKSSYQSKAHIFTVTSPLGRDSFGVVWSTDDHIYL
jgi:hypothetical protein